jgi:four helix bundle protein
MARSEFDLEQRLLAFASRIIMLVDRLPRSTANNHISKQLLRSGTAPLPNHGEAQAAESRADFVHKIRICLKELRETERWLKLIVLAKLIKDPAEVIALSRETDELIRMFVKSVHTARKNEEA